MRKILTLLVIVVGLLGLQAANAQRIGGIPDNSFNPSDSGAPYDTRLFFPNSIFWPGQNGNLFMPSYSGFSQSPDISYQLSTLSELGPKGAINTTTKPLSRGFLRGFVYTPDGRPVQIGTSVEFGNMDTLTLSKSYIRASGSDDQVRRAWQGGRYALPLAADGKFSAGLLRSPGSTSTYTLWITNNPTDTFPALPTRTVLIQIDTTSFAEVGRIVLADFIASAATYVAASDQLVFVGRDRNYAPASIAVNAQGLQTTGVSFGPVATQTRFPFDYLNVLADRSYQVAGYVGTQYGIRGYNADGTASSTFTPALVGNGKAAIHAQNGVVRAACYDTNSNGRAVTLRQYVLGSSGSWAFTQSTGLDPSWGAGKPLFFLSAQNGWFCETGKLPFGSGEPEPKYRFIANASTGALTAFGNPQQGILQYTGPVSALPEPSYGAPNQILLKGNMFMHNGRLSPSLMVINPNGNIDPNFTTSLRFPARIIRSLSFGVGYPIRVPAVVTGNRMLFGTYFDLTGRYDSSSFEFPDTLYRFGFDGVAAPLANTVRGCSFAPLKNGNFVLAQYLTADGRHRGPQQYNEPSLANPRSASLVKFFLLNTEGELIDTIGKLNIAALPDSLTNHGRLFYPRGTDDAGGIWFQCQLNTNLGSDGPGQHSYMIRLVPGKAPKIIVIDSLMAPYQIQNIEALPGGQFRFFGEGIGPRGRWQVALIDTLGHYLIDPDFTTSRPYQFSEAYGVRGGTPFVMIRDVLADGRILTLGYQGQKTTAMLFQRDGRQDPSFLPITADCQFYTAITSNRQLVISLRYSKPNNTIGQLNNEVGNMVKNGLYSFKLNASPVGKGFVGGKVERVASPVLPGQGCSPIGRRTAVQGSVVTAGGRIAITDTAGFYSIALDTGRYAIAQDLPNDFLMRQVCPLGQASRSFYLSRQLQTILGQDFINESYDCPRMTLNFSTSRGRLCSKGTINVSYKNDGMATLPDARLRLFLPAEVIGIVSSERPFVREADSSYTVALGNIAPGQSGGFRMVDTINCINPDTNLRICFTARIEPMSVCGQIATAQINWDGAWLDAKAQYMATGPQAGQVRYRIYNRGANMRDSVVAQLTSQNFYPAFDGKLKLDAGDSLTLYVQGGTTFSSQLYIKQPANCPLGTGGTVGFAGQGATPTFLSLQEGWLGQQTVSRCIPVRFSFDPNEKEVFPERLAEPGQRLDYTIHFENLGNDSAFAVIVLDTLAPELDVTRFTFEGSSHPCKVTLEGTTAQPVLNFAFLPISLPAKKQDSVASKGYVKFSLGLKPSVPRGTFVNNRASIYFDRNPAVVTEYVTIQVRPNEQLTGLQTRKGGPSLTVAPNPSTGSFRVQVPQGRYGNQLMVRDMAGKLISLQAIRSGRAEVSGLGAGIYTVQVEGLKATRVVVNP